MSTSPLNDALTPKVRQYLYAALTLASVAYGIWQVSGGDWGQFIAALFPALLGELARANVKPAVRPIHEAD